MYEAPSIKGRKKLQITQAMVKQKEVPDIVKTLQLEDKSA